MKRYKVGDKRYVGFSTEGNMIPHFRNPILLYVEMTKGGYKILKHLYGKPDRTFSLQTKVGTNHWVYPYTKIFETPEQGYEWINNYWNDVIKQIDDSREKTIEIIKNLPL